MGSRFAAPFGNSSSRRRLCGVGTDYAVDRTSALEAGRTNSVEAITWKSCANQSIRLLIRSDTSDDFPRGTRFGSATDKTLGRARLVPVQGRDDPIWWYTSCVEVRADGEIIVLDAGRGLCSRLALEKELDGNDKS